VTVKVRLGLAGFGESITNGEQTHICDQGDTVFTIAYPTEEGVSALVWPLHPGEAFWLGTAFLRLAIRGKISKTFQRHVHLGD